VRGFRVLVGVLCRSYVAFIDADDDDDKNKKKKIIIIIIIITSRITRRRP
jgi:hypothetical protein